MQDATVCITGRTDSTVYALQTTDANGDAHFVVYPLVAGDIVYVTVTGRNLKPYEGSIVTVNPGCEETVHLDRPAQISLNIIPNPGHDRILLEYDAGTVSREISGKGISLQICDATGRVVKGFGEHELNAAQDQTVVWHGTDALGHPLPDGVYFVLLKSGRYEVTKKITLLR
jgi:hypothetical protein